MELTEMTLEELAQTRADYKRQVDEATNPVQRELARTEYVRCHRELFSRWSEAMAMPRAIPASVIGQLASIESDLSESVPLLVPLKVSSFEGNHHLSTVLRLLRRAQSTVRSVLQKHGADMLSVKDREDAEEASNR